MGFFGSEQLRTRPDRNFCLHKYCKDRYAENRHHFLVPDFSGNVLHSSPFRVLLTVGCYKLLLLCSGVSPVSLISSGLSSWSNVQFCQWHFLHLIRLPCGFYLLVLFMWLVTFWFCQQYPSNYSTKWTFNGLFHPSLKLQA